MRFLHLFFLGFLFFAIKIFSEQPHHQTAFIGSPGECECLWSYSQYKTNHFWNKHGKKLPTFNHFCSQSYHLYAECAVHPCHSLFFDAGYAQVEESLNGHSRGFEDVELGWKWLLYPTETSALTSQLTAIIPAGDSKSSIRYGKFGADFSLLYSKCFSLYDRCAWWDLALGYRHYQGFPSDQIRSDVAIGWDILPRIQLIASSNLIYGLGNGKEHFNRNNVTLNPNFRLLKVHVECVVCVFKHISLSVGAYQHVWGRDVGTGGGWFGGLWMDF